MPVTCVTMEYEKKSEVSKRDVERTGHDETASYLVRGPGRVNRLYDESPRARAKFLTGQYEKIRDFATFRVQITRFLSFLGTCDNAINDNPPRLLKV